MEKRFLSFLILFPLVFSSVYAASTIIQPESIVEPLHVGDEFTLDVKIYDVKDLYIFEFKLGYDPKLLKAEDVEVSFLNEPFLVAKKDIDDEAGIVHVVATSYGPVEPKSGSGALATVTFKVKGRGMSNLHLYETQLMKPDAELIEHSVNDGIFDNRGFGVPKETLGLIFLILLIVVLFFVFSKRMGIKKGKKSR